MRFKSAFVVAALLLLCSLLLGSCGVWEQWFPKEGGTNTADE